MGKRGPAKEPTALKIVKGTASPEDADLEPTPAPGDLVAPTQDGNELDDEVREVWDYTVAQLEGMGLAHPSDRDALLCYCEAVVAHRKASAAIARSGLLLRTQRGGTYMRNPLLVVQRDSAALVRAFAREFGLTPSARSDFGRGERGHAAEGPERYLS
jgi:P27 family predicted phage terminase small subunit